MTAVTVWLLGVLIIGLPLVALLTLLGWIADALEDNYEAK